MWDLVKEKGVLEVFFFLFPTLSSVCEAIKGCEAKTPASQQTGTIFLINVNTQQKQIYLDYLAYK